MKRLVIIVLVLLCACTLHAQGGPPVAITATITGSNGVLYQNGTARAQIVVPGNAQPTYNGYPVSRTIPVVKLDGFGVLRMTVWQNNLLFPAGSSWAFAVCDQTGVYCFTTPGITINAPADFSAAISAYAPPLPTSGSGIPYPPAGVPVSAGSAGPWSASLGVQGTDTKVLTSGTVSGVLALICTDSNGGATTLGCPSTGSALLSADNTWTNNNRFKGPDPFRDISSYTGVGDCSTTDDPRSILGSGGTISASSKSLSYNSGGFTFKVGCGIAVTGAGPTSTISPPGAGCTISSIVGNGSSATITCAAPHGIGTESSIAFAVQLSGVTDSGFDGTFQVDSVTDSTHLVINSTHNATSSGGTVNALWGYAHGVTGSTTYNYWFVSVDSAMGYSAAVGPATITNGNATLTVRDTNGNANFNWLNVPPVQNSYMIAVYEGATEGAATCVGITFNMGYDDFGLTIPCPIFLPTHPPGSAGNQTLNTTITGISGSTITLAAAATNSSSGYVLHDESSFLNSCLASLYSDQSGPNGDGAASSYCYVPPSATAGGLWWMNGMISTGTTANNFQATAPIYIAGAMRFDLLPWFIEGPYNIQGAGGGGNNIGTFFNQPTVPIYFGPNLPAAFVFRKGTTDWQLSNLSLPFLNGYGLWMGDTWDAGGSVAGGLVNAVTIGLADGAGGSPLWFDNNVIGITITNSSFVPRDSGGQPFAVFTMSDYGGNTLGDISLTGINTEFHGIRIDSPACNFTGGDIGAPGIGGWLSESLHDPSVVQFDNGSCAPGGQPAFAGFGVSGSFSDSDAVPMVHERCGPQTGLPGGCTQYEGAAVNGSLGQETLLSCGPDPSCDSPGVQFLNVGGPDTNATGSLGEGQSGISMNANRLMLNGLPLVERPNQFITNQPYYEVSWDPPYQPTFTTGSGTLAAGTFCFEIFGVAGIGGLGGNSEPSTEKCTTLSANSSISGTFNVTSPFAFSSYLFYYCVTCSPGGENKYATLGGTTFSLSSDSGTPGTPPTSFNAFLSGFFWAAGYDCLLCAATPTGYPLGIGVWPNGTELSGVKLHVSAAVRSAENGFWSDENSAPSCNSGEDQMWGDSGAHRWRMCNNNGSVTSIAGLADFAAPPAIGNTTPAPGTFTQLNLAEVSAPSGVSAQSVFWANAATHWPGFISNAGHTESIAGLYNTLTPGDCVEVNTAAGEMIDAGGPCGSGGSGSVTSVNMENITTATQNLATCSTADPSTTADITCTLANFPAHTFLGNNTGSAGAPDAETINEASLPNTTVFTDTANTFGAHLNDFSAATVKLPVSAGATTSANGNIAYDTTNKNWHIWDNAADRLLPVFSTTPTNGQCVTTSVSTSIVLLLPGSCTSGVTLETNSVNNTSQSVLNLTNTSGGNGIAFNNPSGGVVTATLASSTGGGNAALLCTLTGAAQGDILAFDSTPKCVNAAPGIVVNAQTTGFPYTIQGGDGGSSDRGKLITISSATAVGVTLPQAGTTGFAAGYYTTVTNVGVGAVTITPATSTLCGLATVVLLTGQQVNAISDGTNYSCTRSGVSPLQAYAIKTAQTSSISATTLFTTGGNDALYRASLDVDCTSTSAAETLTPAVKFTDTSNTVQTIGVGTAAVCTTLGTASVASLTYSFQAKASTNIQYQMTASTSAATWNLRVALEQLTPQ